ncbi:MAG TPA: amidohydrolase family protein [Pseudonocardia sp.]|nr:amidohydrolase family protein [Pseudonocardia sp.]
MAHGGSEINEAPRTGGVVDCDVHNTVPHLSELFPYLPERWRDYCVEHGVQSLETALYPPGVDFSARPEAREEASPPGSDPEVTARHVLDRQTDVAVLNCLYAVQPIQNEDWAAAMVSALNDWQAARWLAADDRFRASIVVSLLDPVRAAEEIDRWAPNRGFVQVLLPTFTDIPLGRRRNWPIYEAAQRARLPVAVHPAVSGGNPTTASGWPSFSLEDQIAISGVMQSQLVSLVCEGVFQKFPELDVVLAESGATWLPSLMWRLTKNWKALRREIPWVTETPSEIVRRHVRLTVAPFDAPADGATVLRLVEQIGTPDVLLYASDYPHWHARDAEQALLCHLSEQERAAVLWSNAAKLYRLTA